MRTLLYSTLIALYMLSQFVPHLVLHYTIGIIAVIVLILSFFHAKGIHRITGILFFSFGVILFLFNGLPWHTFFLHFQSMLGLLSLFLVLPFINSLIRIGRYDKSLSQLLRDRVTRLTTLYKRSFLVSHFLGVFLNMATLPLLIGSLKPSLQTFSEEMQNRYFCTNLLRAYALCLTWSPLEVLVSRAIDITGAPYHFILPIVIGIVAIAIGVDFAISSLTYKGLPLTIEVTQQINYKNVYKKVAQMLAMLIVFVMVVSWIQQTLEKGFLFSVVLLMIPFSIIWSVMIKKTKSYLRMTIPYWKQRTKGLADYFFMFLSAGLFVEVLSISGLLSFLQPIFQNASESPLQLYLLIAGYYLFTSFIGFHPLISLTFLAEFLVPILPHVATLPLAVVLITCGLATVMYSPFNLSVSLMANELKVNPFRITRWNVGYAICFMLISIAVAAGVEKVFYS